MLAKSVAAATAIVLAFVAPATAQKFEWSETLNLPKGQNMPQGIKAELLGVEVGMSYKEAKAALERLLAEVPQKQRPAQSVPDRLRRDTTGESDRAGIREWQQEFTLPVQGGPAVQVSYVGRLLLSRQLPGVGGKEIHDSIDVHLTAPSSGHQVVTVSRTVVYQTPEDQPKLSETAAALRKKFGAEPRIEKRSDGEDHVFSFSNGKANPPLPGPWNVACGGVFDLGEFGTPPSKVASLNAKRACDVLLIVMFNYGISPDHVSGVTFALKDTERGKANTAADYAFLDAYMRTLQQRTRGAPPKL